MIVLILIANLAQAINQCSNGTLGQAWDSVDNTILWACSSCTGGSEEVGDSVSCCCTTAGCVETTSVIQQIFTYPHQPSGGTTVTIAMSSIISNTVCQSCQILNSQADPAKTSLTYDHTSYLTIDSSGISFTTTQQFYLLFDLQCQNGFGASGGIQTFTGFSIEVSCDYSQASSFITAPSSLLPQTFYIQEGAIPFYQFSEWANSNPSCPLDEYWASCSGGSDTTCSNGVDSTLKSASPSTTHKIYLHDAQKYLGAQTYTFYIVAGASGTLIYMPTPVTISVLCGPSSVIISHGTYTQLQSVQITETTYEFPFLFQAAFPSSTLTNACDPLTFTILGSAASPSSIFFESAPVIGSGKTVLNLLSSYHGLPGQYSFQINVQANGGANKMVPGTLEILCDPVTLNEPADFSSITTITLDAKLPGTFQSFSFSQFTSSLTPICDPILYAVTTSSSSVIAPSASMITYPATSCPETPCRTFEVKTDILITDLKVYIYAKSDSFLQLYSQPITINVVCGPASTIIDTVTDSTVQVQYGDVAEGEIFIKEKNLIDNPICPIIDYKICPSIGSLSPPVSGLEDGVITATRVEIKTKNPVKEQQIQFYLYIVAAGGASVYTGPYIFKLGCGAYVDIYLSSSHFLLTQIYEIRKPFPDNKYSVVGFISESPYCKIAKYEIVPSEVDGIAYPHIDSQPCAPVSLAPPRCSGSCPMVYSPPSCPFPDPLQSINLAQCSVSYTPPCNLIEITQMWEVDMTFQIQAYLASIDTSPQDVDTNKAPTLLSPEITLTSQCGPGSTDIETILASDVHTIDSTTGVIEILLDENNVDGMPEWFDVQMKDMVSSTPGCPIIDYDLSSDPNSIISYTHNGINKPVLTSNGFYTIRLRTDTLEKYEFFILATAKGGANNYSPLSTAQFLKIHIVCGSETISTNFVNNGLKIVNTTRGEEAVEILYGKVPNPPFIKQITLSNILNQQIDVSIMILQTSKPLCPVKRYELYDDPEEKFPVTSNMISFNQANDPQNANIQVFSQDKLYIEVYLKGISDGDKSSIVPIVFVVCGWEILHLEIESPLTFIYKIDQSSRGQIIPWKEIQTWFRYERSDKSSFTCDNWETRVYADEGMQNQVLPFDIQYLEIDLLPIDDISFDILIVNNKAYQEKSYWVSRETLGGNSKKMQLVVEVCGAEEVSLKHDSDYYKFVYVQSNPNATKLSVIPLSEFKDKFISSSKNCPVVKYQIVQGLQGKYYEFDEPSIFMDKEFQINVDIKKELYSNFLFIRASTECGLQHGYLPFQVIVGKDEASIFRLLGKTPIFEGEIKDVSVQLESSTSKVVRVDMPKINDREAPLEKIDIQINGIGSLQFNKKDKSVVYKQMNIDGIQMTYDQTNNQIIMEFPDQDLMKGQFTVEIFLGSASQRKNYEFQLKFPEKEKSQQNKSQVQIQKQKKEKIVNQYIISAKIQSINQFGKVVIKFGSRMKTENINISSLNSTYFDMYVMPSNNWIKDESDFNISNLNFTWNITSYEKDEMCITLNFTNPIFISTKSLPDSLIFHIKNASYFFDGNERPNEFLNPMFYTLEGKIPRQIVQSGFIGSFSDTFKINKEALAGSLFGSFFMNLIITGALSKLLCFITSLQLIIHLPIMTVVIPPNVIVILKILIPIVMFDVLEGIDFINDLFQQEEDIDIIEQVQQLGYNANVILNLGTLYVLMLLYFLKMCIIGILKILSYYTDKFKRFQSSLISQVFFGEFIYLFTEGYLDYLLSGLLGLKVRSGTSDDHFFVHLTTFIVLLICFIIPAINVYILRQPIERIRSKEFRNLWGAAYNKVKLSFGKIQIAYSLIFVSRRAIFILISYTLFNYPGIQIQVLMLLNLFVLIYQGNFWPLLSKKSNLIELFNEICISIASWHLVGFTDYIPDLDTQEDIGWSLIGVIGINITVNLGLFLKEVYRDFMLLYKKYSKRLMHRYPWTKILFKCDFSGESQEDKQNEMDNNSEREGIREGIREGKREGESDQIIEQPQFQRQNALKKKKKLKRTKKTKKSRKQKSQNNKVQQDDNSDEEESPSEVKTIEQLREQYLVKQLQTIQEENYEDDDEVYDDGFYYDEHFNQLNLTKKDVRTGNYPDKVFDQYGIPVHFVKPVKIDEILKKLEQSSNLRGKYNKPILRNIAQSERPFDDNQIDQVRGGKQGNGSFQESNETDDDQDEHLQIQAKYKPFTKLKKFEKIQKIQP